MSSILDSMITSYDARGPQIIGEQHDRNQIDYGGDAAIKNASGRRPSEPWDSSEYGISLATAQQQYDDAQTPEAREKVIMDLKQRAISRAGLASANGKISVMVAGVAPWHKLGVNVKEAVSSKDAAKLASIDWLVSKLPLHFQFGDAMQEADGVFAIVRKDTGDMLGHVGSRYKPIQNEDGFDFLDSVLTEFGARYETAGAIHSGKKVWMQVHLPKQAFAVNGSDRVEPYAIFTNSHDGTSAARCYATSQRVVCANTFRMAQAGQKDGISIAHMGSLKGKIAQAQTALGLAVKSFDQFKETAESMASTQLPDFAGYAGCILDAVLNKTEIQLNGELNLLDKIVGMDEADKHLQRKLIEKEQEKRKGMLDDMLDRYDSAKNGVNGMRGTVWAGFNAITEHADWSHKYKGSDEVRESRRFESVLNGDADRIKQVAYEEAVKILAA